MRVTMNTRKEITKATRRRYQKASKMEKSRILDEICELAGWHRKHAIRTLNKPVEPPVKRGSKVLAKPKETRGRKPVYTDEVLSTLRKVWASVVHGYSEDTGLRSSLIPSGSDWSGTGTYS